MHQEYCKLVLQEINNYINKTEIADFVAGAKVVEVKEKNIEESLQNIQICPETPRSKTGLDNLPNFVDINDPFLMPVFEKYLIQETVVEEKKIEPSLYEL